MRGILRPFVCLPFWKLKTGVAADLSHCTSNSKCFGYTGDDLKKAVKDCHVRNPKPYTGDKLKSNACHVGNPHRDTEDTHRGHLGHRLWCYRDL